MIIVPVGGVLDTQSIIGGCCRCSTICWSGSSTSSIGSKLSSEHVEIIEEVKGISTEMLRLTRGCSVDGVLHGLGLLLLKGEVTLVEFWDFLFLKKQQNSQIEAFKRVS